MESEPGRDEPLARLHADVSAVLGELEREYERIRGQEEAWRAAAEAAMAAEDEAYAQAAPLSRKVEDAVYRVCDLAVQGGNHDYAAVFAQLVGDEADGSNSLRQQLAHEVRRGLLQAEEEWRLQLQLLRQQQDIKRREAKQEHEAALAPLESRVSALEKELLAAETARRQAEARQHLALSRVESDSKARLNVKRNEVDGHLRAAEDDDLELARLGALEEAVRTLTKQRDQHKSEMAEAKREHSAELAVLRSELRAVRDALDQDSDVMQRSREWS